MDRHPAFHVEGLDCAEEVSVLKRAVGPLVGGEEGLAFDVLRGKMTVLLPAGRVPAEEIRRAVAATGMRARPWRPEAPAAAGGLWSRHGRTVACAASGLLLAAGLVLEVAAAGGLRPALEGSAPPLAAVLCFLGAIVAGAWFVLPKAFYAARALRPDIHLLMTVAVAGAIGLGEWVEAASVAFLFALALLLERWSVGRARRAIEALLDLAPPVARYSPPGSDEVREGPVTEVPVGATVRVRPGERIPLDGVVVSGATAVDQAPITGESMPVAKAGGDEVYAGSLNGDGAFDFRVTRAAADSTLARIIRLVEEAQSHRAPAEQWVERFARVYTPLMMGLALLVVVVPPLLTGGVWGPWLYRGLVLLVIACPCALVLSTPVTVVAGLASAARAGVLIKGGVFLEAPAHFRTMAFDKTGTLTHGRARVQRIVALNGHSDEELLVRAAALEAESTHPMARAILAAAAARGVSFAGAAAVTAVPGKGAEGIIDGRRFWIGSHRFMEEKGAETPEYHEQAQALEDEGHTLVAVGNDRHVCGLISFADEVRRTAPAMAAELRRAGVRRLVLLTGDNERTARAVTRAVGLDECRAELLPEDKVASIRALAAEGSVAMVGDGVNDAPALAAATAGIAMAAVGTDAAIETADIALMSDDLERLPWLIRHSRRALRVIRQNIVFSLAVKAVFAVLAGFGIATLWMAIAADMGASLAVIANALRLLRAAA